jgi:mRNA interferase MazF
VPPRQHQQELVRGNVYAATLPHIGQEKYFLVVSNNQRNRALGTALAVRLTTSEKPPLSSIVELGAGEIFVGRVCCDDVEVLYPEDVRINSGALTPGAMRRVEQGICAAFGVRRSSTPEGQ